MNEGATSTLPEKSVYQERVDISLKRYRGRLLFYLEETFDGVLDKAEMVALIRRAKVITGSAWDDIRGIIMELETEPSPGTQLIEVEARMATLETQVLEGGAGTLKGRVTDLERR